MKDSFHRHNFRIQIFSLQAMVFSHFFATTAFPPAVDERLFPTAKYEIAGENRADKKGGKLGKNRTRENRGKAKENRGQTQ